MSGTIAYCSRDDHTPPLFTTSLAGLMAQHPRDTLVHVIGNDIADSRNRAVQQAKGDWIWFIDSDMVFQPDTLRRLLAHNVDIVQLFCVMRHPPHEPVLYEESIERRDPMPHGKTGLRPVQTLGAGGTLYRGYVFEKIQPPWFEGTIGSEDVGFAQKARAAGFTLHVDLDTTAGHLTSVAVWPHHTPDGWCLQYQLPNGHSMVFDLEKESAVQA